ncbi:MAG: hypothetical protein E7184_00035 [Erysipelotrichaceae bacterium]|nr:hypothetical protein [Erysipelotrichaceae bacterium]
MKKIFCFLALSFAFICFFTLSINTKAASCTINNVEYELPKTIGIKNYHSITIYDALPTNNELPSSFDEGITLINIENESSCQSIENYQYQMTTTYNNKMGKTIYNYKNIILDTNNDFAWSYSYNWPKFTATPTSYEVKFSGSITSTIDVIYYANVGQLTSLDKLLSYIKASEDVKNLNAINVEPISNEYESSYNQLGNYLVTFRAIDANNNISILNMWVNVVDIISPTIDGPTSLESKMSSPLTIEEITSFLIVSDNYDQNVNISLLVDCFTFNEQKIGSFEVQFISIDSSDNQTIHTITITTIDDVPPIIKGVTKIIKGSNSSMDTNYVISKLQMIDNIEGSQNNLTIFEDNYSNNENKEGIYYLSLIATDSQGNSSEPYIINIEVYDSVPPIFHVDENIIVTDTSRLVTKEEIWQLFIKTNQLKEESIANLSLIQDTYTNNYKKAGTYSISYSLETNEQIKILSVDIEVNKNRDKKSNNISFFLGIIALLSSILIIKTLTKKLIKI